jgi:uncharacterized protein
MMHESGSLSELASGTTDATARVDLQLGRATQKPRGHGLKSCYSPWNPPSPSEPVRARARRGLGVYFAVLVGLTGVVQARLVATGDPIEAHPGLVLGLMWSPAAASLVARLWLREGPHDVSFRAGGWRGARALLLAWLYPLAVGLAAYGLAWGLGLERFLPPASGSGLAHGLSPLGRFGYSLSLNATLGALIGAVSAGGEELGWRGYMLTRLIDAGVGRPVLLSGIIWALWHVPLILTGQYAAGPRPWLSAALFVPGVVAAGYVAARVRLSSGSIWPPIVFHATWNAVIQGSFDKFTAGGSASRGAAIWTGESGLLVVLVSLVAATVVTWKPWAARRAPGDEPSATLSVRSS